MTKENKLYPESNWISSDVSKGSVYEKRWERIGKALLLISATIGTSSVFVRYRTNKKTDKSILDLDDN